MPVVRRLEQTLADVVLHLGFHVPLHGGPYRFRINRLQGAFLHPALAKKTSVPFDQSGKRSIARHTVHVNRRRSFQTG